MRRPFATVLALAALAVAAAPAAAAERVVRDTAGDVTAELRFRYTPGTSTSDRLRLTVTRAGAVVRSGSLRVPGTVPGFANEPPVTRFLGQPDMQVVDLDADTIPEVVVDVAQPGAYCCARTLVVRLTPTGVTEHPRYWGAYTTGPVLVSDAAGGRIFVGNDPRFDGRFVAHVASFEPTQVIRFRAGRYQLATREFPQFVQRDLNELRRLRPRLLREGVTDLRGLMAAIAGNLYLLGRGSEAEAELSRALAAGHLDGDGLGGVARRAYIRALKAELRRGGYIR